MEAIGYIEDGKGSSISLASVVLTVNLSDHPFERIARTPLLTTASITQRVIALGSETTMLPKPM